VGTEGELYSRLVEALYDIHYYNAQWIENYHEDSSNLFPEQTKKREEREEALRKRNHDGTAEVEKLTIIGTFIISAAVQEDLFSFKKAELEGWRIINDREGRGM
jgi:hypothetical protein